MKQEHEDTGRVAILSVRDPIPVFTGLLERTYQTARYLGERQRVRLYYPFEGRRKKTDEGRVPSEQPFERVGLHSRVLDVLEGVVPPYSPLKGLYHVHPWLYPSLRSELREYDPSTVIVEFPFLMPLARLATRDIDCRIILSEHNVEYLFAKRLDVPFWRLLKRFELAMCRLADAVVTVSEHDADVLRSHLGGDVPIRVAPNGVDERAYRAVAEGVVREIRDRYQLRDPVLVFHGNLGNAQNERAVDVLLDQVFPQVTAVHEDASLLLVGADPPGTVPTGVTATGVVEDLPAHLGAADVAVAPIISGSGTNLKIIEYLASEVPVVTTPIGAEGLSLTHGVHALIAEPDAIADEVVRLLADDELGSTLRANGRRLVESEYSWNRTLSPFEELIKMETNA